MRELTTKTIEKNIKADGVAYSKLNNNHIEELEKKGYAFTLIKGGYKIEKQMTTDELMRIEEELLEFYM